MKITNEGWAIVERDSHLGRWVEEHKRLDFDQNALPQMLPYVKGCVAIDIGANIGCYSYAFSQVADYVFCFEPNYESFECLQHNLGSLKNTVLINTALSDKSMPYDVVMDNDNIGMAYIKTFESDKVCRYTTTIDLFFEKHESDILFIKIDVEGYELHVLKGGEQTINKFKPVMVIEINDHTLKRTNTTREEIFQWLTDHGYTFRNIYAEQGLQDEQLDIICFPS